MAAKLWIYRDEEQCCGTILAFASLNWGKSRETSVRMELLPHAGLKLKRSSNYKNDQEGDGLFPTRINLEICVL
jgi:hypothetical protein